MPYEIGEENGKLSSEEVKYWRRMFLSNLKIGVEIETNLEASNLSDSYREFNRLLQQTESTKNFGKNGVYEIKGDGSLINGVEICTVGRRVNFLDLFYQYRYIINTIMPKRPIMNERCGLHNHILLDYNNGNYTCLEKNVPGIIVKNFIQLFKNHAPEIIWLTSTVKADDSHSSAITRRENFCYGLDIMSKTILGRSIIDYKSAIGTSGNRYIAINLRPLAVDEHDKISTFHMELRFPDGSIYPAQIAAQNILYSAMLLKAIALSEFGVIKATPNYDRTKELYTMIRNAGYSDNRMALAVNPEVYPEFIERANKLLDCMKSSIEYYDGKVYHLLKILANEPISIARRTKSDIEINDYFENIINTMWERHDEEFELIKKAIVLGEITGAISQKDWCNSFSGKSGSVASEVESALFKLSSSNKIEFDPVLGSPIIK
jgi:hypothetical protein